LTATPSSAARPSRSPQAGDSPAAAWLFFKRWLADPWAMGSIAPSSASLRRVIGKNIIRNPDQLVVEFGGGTGAVTRAILEAGVPADKLVSFEIDGELAGYLGERYPDIRVYKEDCRKAAALLGAEHTGKVGTVVIGIPMITFPLDFQREVIEATFSILQPGGRFLLYTFMPHSPLNRAALGLQGKRLGFTPLNLPPASVWGYWRG
jgi:phosphatidylethanolamine/phosphatidyl-N-methylethanolamine N-methyltransferase